MKSYVSIALITGIVGFAGAATSAQASGHVDQKGAWSTVDVHQEQTVTGVSHHVDMEQHAESLTSVHVGREAAAVSHQVGEQRQRGHHAKGTQSQDLHSGANVHWEKDVWPSWTTADTTGSVHQEQSIWSNKPTWSEQHAYNDQGSRIGRGHDAVRSRLTSEAHQRQDDGRGDAHQKQGISGATHAEGYTTPPFPRGFRVRGIGGTIRQFVNVTVENLLSF